MNKRWTLLTLLVISVFTVSTWAKVLCASGPTGTVNATSQTVIYTCTIPANTIFAGQTLRITAETFQAKGGNLDLYINGINITDTGFPTTIAAEGYWNFLFFDTGSTTGTLAGLEPVYNSARPFVGTSPFSLNLTSLNWGATQTLQIQANNSSSIRGDVFLVEVVE